MTMIQKTRGVVIHTIKYTDNSVISHIYTEKFGRRSFIIRITRGKTSAARINLLQHLSLLEMEVYIKQTRDLQKVREIRLHETFSTIPFNPAKNAVALFISEILYKVLREEESNQMLFSFLVNSIKIFDLTDKGYANFHLIFLLHLSRHLGFYPRNNYSVSEEIFDIENARFISHPPGHPNYLDPPVSRYVSELMECSFNGMGNIRLNSEMRNILLTGLIRFYNYHMPGMGQIKSFPVLKEIFS